MKKPFRQELTIMIWGAVVAVIIIVLIKLLVSPHGELMPSQKGIFSLEVAALFLLFGAFVLGEFSHIFERMLAPRRTTTRTSHGLGFGDVALVLVSLAGSLLIYFACIQFFDVPSEKPEQTATSEVNH
jgi:Zn-dependent protease